MLVSHTPWLQQGQRASEASSLPPAMQSDPVRMSPQRGRRLPLPCHPASRCLLTVGLWSACTSPNRTNLPTCTLGAAPGSEQAGDYQQERGPRMCCCSVLPHRGCPGPVGCAERIPRLNGPPVKKEGAHLSPGRSSEEESGLFPAERALGARDGGRVGLHRGLDGTGPARSPALMAGGQGLY